MQLFSISGAEFGGGMRPAIDRFLEDKYYQTLSDKSLESMRNGKGSAFLVPAVKFLVDATCNVLSQSSLQERLPLGIASRMEIARNLARKVVEAAVDGDVFSGLLPQEESVRLTPHSRRGAGSARSPKASCQPYASTL